MTVSHRKIGVIDSGLGGLFTLKNLVLAMPDRDFVYLADTTYLPYGEKSKAELAGRLRKVIAFFESQPVEAVVVACNTLSAVVLSEDPKTELRLFNVINPAVLQLLPEDNTVGVMATEYTVKSGVFGRLISKLGKKPVEVACPTLVDLIESGSAILEVEQAFFKYLNQFKKQPDCLILGCTHYGLLAESAVRFWPGTRVLDTNRSVVDVVKLAMPKGTGSGKVEFFVTGSAERFRKTATLLFGPHFLKGNLFETSLS